MPWQMSDRTICQVGKEGQDQDFRLKSPRYGWSQHGVNILVLCVPLGWAYVWMVVEEARPFLALRPFVPLLHAAQDRRSVRSNV